MPDNLFTGPDDPAYIEAVTLDGTFNATTAFQTLVNLGSLVRGKLEGKQDAEAKILLVLRKYIQWSVDDAKLGEWELMPWAEEGYSDISLSRLKWRGDPTVNCHILIARERLRTL
jgi:hypothetical protein